MEEKQEMKSLTGDEHFTFNGVTINRLLNDFWSWQASDLLSNTLRGALAEYIVATALDVDTSECRNNWYEYDLLYGESRIEVKSSAYLQSWEREGFSRISFTIYPARGVTSSLWDDDDIKRHSDIYVFCLFECKDRAIANPMQLEQWRFFVVSTQTIDASLKSQRTISIPTIRSLEHIECDYEHLRESIDVLIAKSGGNQ